MTVNEKSIIDGLIREIHDQIPTAEYEESEENKGTTALKQGSDQQVTTFEYLAIVFKLHW